MSRNLPPFRGGMERLNLHLARALAARWSLHVIGPRGCRNALLSAASVTECPDRPLWKFLAGAAYAAARACLMPAPMWCIAGSGLTAPLAWLVARARRRKAAVYVHGLDLIVLHRLYQLAWLPFIRRCDLVIANSHHTAALAVAAGVDPARLRVVHPGVGMPETSPSPTTVSSWAAGRQIRPGAIMLCVGRLTERKGLLEFVEHCLPGIVQRQPDAHLVVIGDEAPDALHGASRVTRSRIAELAVRLGVGHALTFLGPVGDDELALAYVASRLCIFPVRDVPGDIEGFGMVALEAAAHGVPTVAFAVGGVPDAVRDGVSGDLIPPGDYSAFQAACLHRMSHVPDDDERTGIRAFAAGLAWPVFETRILDALASVPQGAHC